MVNIEITGILHKIESATISQRGFEKRLFAVKQIGGTQVWQLESHQGMCNALDRFVPGESVTCQVEVQGREWKQANGEYRVTNTFRCWKIDKATPAPAESTATTATGSGR